LAQDILLLTASTHLPSSAASTFPHLLLPSRQIAGHPSSAALFHPLQASPHLRPLILGHHLSLQDSRPCTNGGMRLTRSRSRRCRRYAAPPRRWPGFHGRLTRKKEGFSAVRPTRQIEGVPPLGSPCCRGVRPPSRGPASSFGPRAASLSFPAGWRSVPTSRWSPRRGGCPAEACCSSGKPGSPMTAAKSPGPARPSRYAGKHLLVKLQHACPVTLFLFIIIQI
jgi:hypothetical protein